MVPGAGPGLLFLQIGLALGHCLHLHHQHQLETASKTIQVKMSGKADFTSIQYLICHLQSHMYQRPKVIPANWQETKAGVDPTEEKGVPHPFLPFRGDLCLPFSLQTPEHLLLLLSENRTPSSPFPGPLHLWQEERREGEGNFCVRGVRIQYRNAPSFLCPVYFHSYRLLQLQPARVGFGIHMLLCK